MKLTVFDFEIKHRSEKINSADESSKRSNYKNVNIEMQRFLFILQHKLTMFKNIKQQIVNFNVICVKKLHNLFFSKIFQTTVVVCALNATITLRTNYAMNRVIAGSGFGQMFDPKTVLRSNRTINNVRRVGQLRVVRSVGQF